MIKTIQSNRAGDFTLWKEYAVVRVLAYDEPSTHWLERWSKEVRGSYLPALSYQWQRICLDIGIFMPESTRVRINAIDALIETAPSKVHAIFVTINTFQKIVSRRYFSYDPAKGKRKWLVVRDSMRLKSKNYNAEKKGKGGTPKNEN